MQIKTTRRYSPHTNQNGHHQEVYKHKRGCGEKGNVLHCWWECKLTYRHYGEQYGGFFKN